MKDNKEDNLKNKEDLHITRRHTALDIFRFAVFFVIEIASFIKFRANSSILEDKGKIPFLYSKLLHFKRYDRLSCLSYRTKSLKEENLRKNFTLAPATEVDRRSESCEACRGSVRSVV